MRPLATIMLLVAAAAVLFGQPVYAMWAAAVALTATWILDPGALRIGLRFGVVLAIAFAAAVTAAVVTWSAGLERGAALGGMVLLRLLVLTSVAAVLVRSVDAERVMAVAKRMGFERLGLVLGLAMNSMPRIIEAVGDVWIAHVMRKIRPFDLLIRLPTLGEVLLAHTARIAEEAAAAASLRGHAALTSPRGVVQVPVRTVVVTGPPDGGKTSAVTRLAATLEELGIPVAGFEQRGVVEDGRKVGFKLRDLVSGEQAELARRSDREDGDFGTRFRFSNEGFSLGRRALERARRGSVVIVDELGPVELRGEGHMPAVERALAVPGLLAAVIVVRRSLVPSLVAAIEATDTVIVDVVSDATDDADAIFEALAIEADHRA